MRPGNFSPTPYDHNNQVSRNNSQNPYLSGNGNSKSVGSNGGRKLTKGNTNLMIYGFGNA